MKIYDELLRDFPFLLLNKETNSLSFAEKKIMLFCGIIIKECQVLLLDEPLAGLSIEYRKKVIDIILQQKKSGKIIIIAEHNNDFDDIADEVICL
jgi:ABC-type Na+ transport system ATPase subunit NatA